MSGAKDGTLRLWDTEGFNEAGGLTGHEDAVRACAWFPDGQRVASCSADQTLRVWAVETKECQQTFVGLGPIATLAVDAAGNHLVAGDDGGTIYVLRLA